MNDRAALAALIAKWEYDRSYKYHRELDGEAAAGARWDDLDDEYRRTEVIPTGYPLADAILAAGWRAPERPPVVLSTSSEAMAAAAARRTCVACGNPREVHRCT